MNDGAFEELRRQYHELRALEDSGTRGGRTWTQYADVMQRYAEALCDRAEVSPLLRERLQAKIGVIELVLQPPRKAPDLDRGIAELRAAVDEADEAVPRPDGA